MKLNIIENNRKVLMMEESEIWARWDNARVTRQKSEGGIEADRGFVLLLFTRRFILYPHVTYRLVHCFLSPSQASHLCK